MDDALLARLLDDVASPDPRVRDERALPALCTAIKAGQLNPAQVARTGAALVARFEHPQVQARTFAPLVLAELVDARHFDANWLTAFTRWYLREPDLRGYDEKLGWLHAVAHGADFVGACARRPAASARVLLVLLAARMVAPTDYVWRDQEEDRVAHGVMVCLAHPNLAAADATAWLTPVADLLAARAPGPVPANATNAMRTLRSLAVALAQRPVQPGPTPDTVRELPVRHARAVREAISAALEPATPWLWRRR